MWLRHRPKSAGLTLDEAGWTDAEAVLAAFRRADLYCDWPKLLEVINTNDKQRFELSADHSRIRARQGHSVEVELDWPATTPPEHLFHGTVDRFLEPILSQGLKPMKRHHVHLSADLETAARVGSRRGAPVILRIAAGEMARAGTMFLLTGNGVWLTDHVPPERITVQVSAT